MRVSLLGINEINNLILPAKISGSFFVIENVNGQSQDVIGIEAKDNVWVMNSNNDAKIIINNAYVDNVIVKPNKFYLIENNNKKILLYTSNIYDETYSQFIVKENMQLTIGNNNANINYPLNIFNIIGTLNYSENVWTIQKKELDKKIYLNNISIESARLNNGDIINIYGLKIFVINNIICINNPNNMIKIDSGKLLSTKISSSKEITSEELKEEDYYKESDYFLKAPRLKTSIEDFEVVVDSPPTKENDKEIPIIYTLGPMLTMGMSAAVSLATAISSVVESNKTWKEVIPTLLISGSMLLTMLLWPTLSKSFQKKQKIKREKERQKKYTKYIEERRQLIITNMKKQSQILEENFISLENCCDIITNKKSELWNRKIEQDDFLTLKVGRGDIPFQVNIKVADEHFTLDDDDLLSKMRELTNSTKILRDVPIGYSFVNKTTTAIVGKDYNTYTFVNNLILQMMTFYSYDELKIVLLTNKQNEKKWEYMKVLPHSWSNNREIRFFASNYDEMKDISSYLEQEMYERKTLGEEDYTNFSTYYLIITDDVKNARKLNIVENILNQEINQGFGLIMIDSKLSTLPDECNSFINVDDKHSGILEDELISTKQQSFMNEMNNAINMFYLAKILANVPIHFSDKESQIPNVVSFLEMYKVGKVEQLNALNRWKMNNPIKSLQAPIGITTNDNLLMLDLHEKSHGPHGLIAGMTGSGKSELIITFILSIAVNYNPYEASFVIIDYKGGGIAGALEDKLSGLKLPHIAGTITNLDTNELNRALDSIESELRRRQVVFNNAKKNLKESTMDIYKYQKFYREGKIKEPISHLFIICDEFAELKVQQPDFMDELISAARIGRALGIHLILATQKPSGVVNDQIWSNSKFRICLKVQEKSDSMEMIKRPEAAALKQIGRFYLQVGYDELFISAQSAWCGAQYYPAEKFKKPIDRSISFVNNIGFPIKNVDQTKKIEISMGEELPFIRNYLIEIAKQENIVIPQLWLDRIPNIIYVDNLKKKYNYQLERFNINPLIGEYDDPSNQKQGALTLPLTTEGNTIIYGVAGSGKSKLLTTLIYSLITTYTINEINIYALDFGSESLKIFKSMQHVGDVIVSTDKDKIENLFKYLSKEIEKRKKLFSNYNGDYTQYCKTSGNYLPTILVIINNYEAFYEMYEEHDELFLQLTRDGYKFGIVFVATISSITGIRLKTKQNFKQELVLELNDKSDYNSILGNVGKLMPSKAIGRGLVKLDNIYEFQTAFICDDSKLNDYLNGISQKIKESYKEKAINIPTLPEKVTIESFKGLTYNLKNVPIGISKNSLMIKRFDYVSNLGSLITASDINSICIFLVQLINLLKNIANNTLIIIDAEEMLLDESKSITNYCNSNYNEYIDKINIMTENNSDNSITCIIIGLDKLKTKINTDVLTKLIDNCNNYDQLNIIVVEEIIKLKKLEYETWYRNLINSNAGIWIGNDIINQNQLKVLKITKELKEDIEKGFGWVVENGRAELIKLVSDGGTNEE